VSTALGDIGARSSAFVTSVAFTGQAGWTPAATLTTSTVIADAASVTAANFDPTAKWNGTYKGTLLVGLQNDQSITGAAPNDLGTSNFTLSTTVTGNSGNASVNVLAGGSFAGYSIPRGTGKNSTASLLGGTSASGNTVSAVWSDGVNTTLSDRANITKTSSDLLVVQMSYDATAVTGGTATAPTLALPNASGQYISAVLSNSNGGAGSVEVNSAYDGNLVLGHYGIDTTNHTVWAVVDAQGQFEAVQRLFGDANGDGKVDLTDLSTILNNFGSTTAFWSQGNFDGASTIDLTDLSDVLNNFGTSVPGSSVGGASPAEAVPEPASLGVLMLGMGLLLKRRR
jgi:hypothetical protein